MGLSAERMEKIAVTLKELQIANKAMRHLRHKKAPLGQKIVAGVGRTKTTKGKKSTLFLKGDMGQATRETTEGVAKEKAKLRDLKNKETLFKTDPDLKETMRAWLDIPEKSSLPQIQQSKKRVQSLMKKTKRTPEEREALNRTIWQHEKRELREGKRGVKARFASHNNVAPPLQDANIAATLKGPGAGAAKDIRAMRKGEFSELKKKHPTSFGRLNLGHERLSRHAIKRLKGIHAKGQEKLSFLRIAKAKRKKMKGTRKARLKAWAKAARRRASGRPAMIAGARG